MYAFLTIKTDRPITEDHYIVPGGFCIKTNNEEFEFDFLSYEKLDNKNIPLLGITCEYNDPAISCYKLSKPDYDSFPDMKKMFKKLVETESLLDAYVFTGEKEEGDPEINVEELIDFRVILDEWDPEKEGYKNTKRVAPKTNCVTTYFHSDCAEIRFNKNVITDYNKRLTDKG